MKAQIPPWPDLFTIPPPGAPRRRPTQSPYPNQDQPTTSRCPKRNLHLFQTGRMPHARTATTTDQNVAAEPFDAFNTLAARERLSSGFISKHPPRWERTSAVNRTGSNGCPLISRSLPVKDLRSQDTCHGHLNNLPHTHGQAVRISGVAVSSICLEHHP